MDKLNWLPPIAMTPLRKIEHPKGDVFHGIKATDSGYVGFGEAYFTTIVPNEVKGWKKHSIMTMNIIVPIGMVRFHIHGEAFRKTSTFDVGYLNYCRLTIPPGYWVAFQGLTDNTNLILNVANLEHNPMEAVNAPLDSFPLTEL